MRLFKLIQTLSSAGGAIAGISILLMSGLILLEILVRSTIGITLFIAEEYSAYLLVIFGTMALAYTLKSEGHIRVELVLSKLSKKNKLIVNFLCSTIGFLVFILIVYQAWNHFHGSWASKETSMYYSKTPLWLPQLPLFIGSALMALQFLCLAASQFQSLVKTDKEKTPGNLE